MLGVAMGLSEIGASDHLAGDDTRAAILDSAAALAFAVTLLHGSAGWTQ
jgi:hypothetical protein